MKTMGLVEKLGSACLIMSMLIAFLTLCILNEHTKVSAILSVLSIIFSFFASLCWFAELIGYKGQKFRDYQRSLVLVIVSAFILIVSVYKTCSMLLP
jgi:hypothetical protein